MSSTVGSLLVSLSTIGTLGSVFTRDAPLVVGLFYLFWLIFAFTYYVGVATTAEIFWYLPLIVALASATGVAIVKLFDIGQLIDVWLSGSGGGSNHRATRYEELNLPLLPTAIIFAFFAVFFAVAAISCGSVRARTTTTHHTRSSTVTIAHPPPTRHSPAAPG